MAFILNIETSTKNCSVSIGKDGECIALCEESSEQYQHAEKLHLFMQWALEAENLSFKDLSGVCVSKGPGSYTGLRIGVSAAKGICFALSIPLISLNSLEILAHAYQGEAQYILPMIDARRKEVYTAIFNGEKEKKSSTQAVILNENSFQELNDSTLAVLGDGAQKASSILTLTNCDFYPNTLPSAKHMAKLSYEKYQKQLFEDLAYFEPFYLKDFVAGK